MRTLSAILGALFCVPLIALAAAAIGVCYPTAWFIRSFLYPSMDEDLQEALEDIFKVFLG